MCVLKDLKGQKFNRWTVICKSSKTNSFYNVLWVCRCECGIVRDVLSGNLVRGLSKSCGCLNRENHSKHNLSKTAEYKTWLGIKSRCLNPKNEAYNNYGGRGIKICDRWLNSFENFYADMGLKPSEEYSIDRIDNNGHYEPGNCKWNTFEEQQNNKRTNVYHVYNNQKITTKQASKIAKVSPTCIVKRLARGLNIKEAIETKSIKQQRFFECFGMRKNIAEWSRFSGINDSKLRHQLIDLKIPLEKILTNDKTIHA